MTKKTTGTWSDIRAKLADLDRAELLKVVQDLHAASKENQTFLHARFCLGGDVLRLYKAILARWLWPDGFKNQDISIAKAKKAISDYKKAIGRPEGLAELMVFYCEQAAGFSTDIGLQHEGYFNAMVRMFRQALAATASLPEPQWQLLWGRLDSVRRLSHNVGYGVGDDMDALLAEFGVDG